MWRDRIKELRRVPASELLANPENWREHPAEQETALRGVLDKIGIANAVLARENENGELVLIDGHLRSELEGQAEWPVLVLDVSEEEGRALLATMDPLAELARPNYEKLGALMKDLENSALSLSKMNFPQSWLDPLLNATWTKPEIDDAEIEDTSKRWINFDMDQYGIVSAAIRHIQKESPDDKLSNAQAVTVMAERLIA